MKPAIIDMPIQKADSYPKEELERFAYSRLHAKRYILDDEASFWIGRWLNEQKNLQEVIDNWNAFRAPFELCYLELNTTPLYEGLGFNSRDGREVETLGFTHDSNTIYTHSLFSALKFKNSGGPELFAYKLNTPQEKPLSSVYGFDEGRSNELKLLHIFGGLRELSNTFGTSLPEAVDMVVSKHPFIEVNSNTNFDRLQTIADSVSIRRVSLPYIINSAVVGTPEYNDLVATTAKYILVTQGTLLLSMVVFYILMNRTTRVVDVEVPAARTMYLGKSRPIPAHTKVTIHLAPQEKVRLITKEPVKLNYARQSPVPHDVAGCYAHFHMDKDCQHVWEPVGTELGKRFVCKQCGGLKAFRREHRKGDKNAPAPNIIREVHV